MSLRVRIAAIAGLAVAVIAIGGAAAGYVAVRSELRGQVENSLRTRVDRLRSAGLLDSGATPAAATGQLRRLLRRRSSRLGGPEAYAQVVGPAGRALGPPGEQAALAVSPEAKAIARSGEGERLSDEDAGDTHVLVLTAGAGRLGAIQVARPLDEADAAMREVLAIMLAIAAAGVVLAVALGAVVSRAALAPIARFVTRAEALTDAPGSGLRMEEAGGEELERLARSFNSATDALESSLEARRRLVLDAGHELRTPIASLRANVQLLEKADRLPAAELARLGADIVSELDELTALVGDLTELARGEERPAAEDDVRLDLVAEAQAERARRRTEITISCEAEPGVVRGDPERVARAIANLLDNAIKWSPDGGEVSLTVTGGEVAVRDHGPGFEPADLDRAFERFYRADAARSKPGSGLGLAIVAQTARAHGGDARAANAEGGGAIVTASFGPATRPEA